MKILFYTKQKELKEDIDAVSIIFAPGDLDLKTRLKSSEIENDIQLENPDRIVLYNDVIFDRDAWDLGVETVYCAKNEDMLNRGAKYGLKTIGIAKDADDILQKLQAEPYPVKYDKSRDKTASTEDKPVKKEKPAPKAEKPKPKPKPEPEDVPMDLDDLYDNDGDDILFEDDSDAVFEEPKPKKQTKPPVQKTQPKKTTYTPQTEELPALDDDDDEDFFDDFSDIEKELEETKAQPKEVKELPEDQVEKDFEDDLNAGKVKTKVVSVYSAKGGVGKTTIASELATYLSLVQIGPQKLRVCIVDYNIDFGDVKSTLGMERYTKSITYWADDIREKIKAGKDPDRISYTKAEIEEWMVQNDKTGLWVLPAPLTNEDSMVIDSQELRIVLKNLKKYGEFDYIICDTGNNTRDSTMIALENSDMILMIMTQNVNTANCDISFMKTMETIDFDMSNTRLVINNIVPQKLTGISVEEIEKYFPFECVGKIHYNSDVMKATNLGEPLALNPGHDFTKQMKEIVAYVLDDESLKPEPVPEKKGLFGFLKKKKKK